MAAVNEILAPLGNRMETTTATVYQYNSGMMLRITGPELPNAYTVDFANSVTGSSISQVGGPNGVNIPDQFFVPGSYIHAWVVISGAEFAVTRYHIIIPISPRAARTNEEPTPVQQSAINQAIGALNEAVDAAETAVSHYPRINAGYWEIWDPESGAYVSTGVKAQGEPGADGTNGATFTPSVSAEGVISWSNDGGLPNPESVDIKGPPGEPGTGVSIHICSSSEYDATTRVPTVQSPEANAFYLVPAENAASPDMFVEWIFANNAWEMFGSATVEVPVQDVQVNGVSVLQDGVANVPIAGNDGSSLGVVSVSANYGLNRNSSGRLYVQKASEVIIKNGNADFTPIVPMYQHQSTFYGLAKAAGDVTQSASTNAVGTYTDSAKSAIHEMLNGAVSVSGTTPVINALPGVQYVCGEVSTLAIEIPASGCFDVVFESGSTATVLSFTLPTAEYALVWENGFDPSSLDANTTYEINIKIVGTKCLGVAGTWN